MSDDQSPSDPGEPTPVEGTELGTTFGSIEPMEIQQEMEQSFLDYAMSVIVARALPDARDGLKPVHRRILWAMHEAGLRPDRNHKKCATVVGDVLGKYHPHGDQSVYDALVRMGQDFSLRHPLIDPHGNFGSPSDPPAAYRYTECRLTALAMHMLAGIDENTVDFSPNFDGSSEEPVVLPGRFPNLLVNGSQGIAVGMATNIPPHNLGEVIDATMHLLDHPDATPDDLMEFVKGPDFPTGAQIMGRAGLVSAFRTGRGSIKMRAKAEIEETAKGGERIVVSEIPYQTSVEQIEETDRGAREREDHRGGPGDPQRALTRHHPTGDRAEEGRSGERPAEQPLQAHAVADDLLGQLRRTRRRRSPHVEPARGPGPLRRAPGRGDHPSLAVPARQGAPPCPHRRGLPEGTRPDRRDHRHHPCVGGPELGDPRAAGGAASSSPRSRPPRSSTCGCRH